MSFHSILSTYKIFTVLILAVLLNACGTDEDLIEDQNNNSSGISTFAFDQKYLLDTSEGISVVPDHTVSLSFGQERETLFINLHAGCNAMGGSIETIDSILHVNELNSTLIACEQALMEQDIIFSNFISNQPRIVWDSSSVTLSNETMSLRFILENVLQPDLSLISTLWTVNGFIDGGIASSSVSSNSDVFSQQTIRFESNYEVKVHLGCNSCFGNYEVDGNQISFTSLECTEAVCQTEEDQAVEDLFSSLLFRTITYEIEGNSLTLMNADQQRAITLSGSEL